jgi:hypothetical protein
MGAPAMTNSYRRAELQPVFAQKCLNKFRYLSAYGCELVGIEEDSYGTDITYKNQPTGIRISFEIRENDIFVYLIRLINGEIPPYLDAPSRWFYLDNLVRLRSPETTLPRKEAGDWLTSDDIDEILTAYAGALKEYGEDVLRGDFSIFAELARQVDRPRPSHSIDEIQLIASDEELSTQRERLLPQIVEYYDTYFSELRSQLRRPNLFSEAIPEFLKDFKRIISIGGEDGVVVAHFPIELDITFLETGTGSTFVRFTSVLNAGEDAYEFLQMPNVPVRELANVISGGEDIESEIPPEGVFWGVRVFRSPQQKVDAATGKLVWQSPWTRLAAVDLYHLRYWENTERARQEAREDIEAYVLDEEPYAERIPTYEEPIEIRVPKGVLTWPM